MTDSRVSSTAQKHSMRPFPMPLRRPFPGSAVERAKTQNEQVRGAIIHWVACEDAVGHEEREELGSTRSVPARSPPRRDLLHGTPDRSPPVIERSARIAKRASTSALSYASRSSKNFGSSGPSYL